MVSRCSLWRWIWQIHAITGRALDLGLIRPVQFARSLLLALPAGHVADGFERRRIVLSGQAVEWLAVTLLAALTLSQGVHEVCILVLMRAIGATKAFEFPSLQAMLPALVPPRVLPRVMAVNASASWPR